MKVHFTELMKLSDKGYIDDQENVKKITDALVNSTLDELTVPCYDTMQLGRALLYEKYLPYSRPQDICFGELANLLRINCLERMSPTWSSKIKDVLACSSGYIGKARLFTAVTVKAFTDYIDAKTGTSMGSMVYSRIQFKALRWLSFEITDTMTIGQLFCRMGPSMTQWNNTQPLEAFTEYALTCCEITDLLFIDCLRFAYGEMFSLVSLKDRITADCKDWKNRSDFDRQYGVKYEDISYLYAPYDNYRKEEEERYFYESIDALDDEDFGEEPDAYGEEYLEYDDEGFNFGEDFYSGENLCVYEDDEEEEKEKINYVQHKK
ncbi:MAG: hypothetical protein J1F11_04950 [Oscillospiraceae bacterium]|nr:hypothetical protein [Oscillospiraceae bacterium]